MNGLANDVEVRLLVGTDGSGGTISAMRHIAEIGNTGQAMEIGRCLAKAQLFETLDVEFPDSGLIPAFDRFAVASYLLPSGGVPPSMVGAVHEFTILAQASNVFVETIVVPAGYSGSYILSRANPLPLDPHNIRGSWPYSNISAIDSTPSYDASPLLNSPQRKSYYLGYSNGEFGSKTPGVDNGLFAKRFGDTFASPDGNLGLYGVVVDYTSYPENSAGTSAPIRPSLRARNTGDPWAGAVEGPFQFESLYYLAQGPGPFLAGGVPNISYGTPKVRWHYTILITSMCFLH